jgi:hypothetical protein
MPTSRKKNPAESGQNMGNPHPHVGSPRTEETRQKIRLTRLGKHYPKLSLAKIGEKNHFFGKQHTKEWKEETRERLKPFFYKKGQKSNCYWKGKKNPHITGSKNPRWKGGISQECIKIRNSPAYDNWRRTILIRDRWTCKRCGQKNIKIEVHHIKSFKDYPDLRFDIQNGITLCINCHMLTRR